MTNHIVSIGVLLILLSFVHIIFPKYFNWNEELKSLSLINRQMMLIHTFFIAFVVFLIGVLCLTNAQDLIHTRLGKNISFGLAIFWSIRFIIQLFGYSVKLWRGKLFETIVHIVFTGFWLYISSVFWINYFAPY